MMLGEAWLIIIDGGGDGENVSCGGLDHSNKSDLTDIEYYRLQVKMKRSDLSSAKPGRDKARAPGLKSSIPWTALLTGIP